MDTKILIETLLAKIQSREQIINGLIAKVAALEAELAICSVQAGCRHETLIAEALS